MQSFSKAQLEELKDYLHANGIDEYRAEAVMRDIGEILDINLDIDKPRENFVNRITIDHTENAGRELYDTKELWRKQICPNFTKDIFVIGKDSHHKDNLPDWWKDTSDLIEYFEDYVSEFSDKDLKERKDAILEGFRDYAKAPEQKQEMQSVTWRFEADENKDFENAFQYFLNNIGYMKNGLTDIDFEVLIANALFTQKDFVPRVIRKDKNSEVEATAYFDIKDVSDKDYRRLCDFYTGNVVELNLEEIDKKTDENVPVKTIYIGEYEYSQHISDMEQYVGEKFGLEDGTYEIGEIRETILEEELDDMER